MRPRMSELKRKHPTHGEDGNVACEPLLERQERRDGVAVRDRRRPSRGGPQVTAPSRTGQHNPPQGWLKEQAMTSRCHHGQQQAALHCRWQAGGRRYASLEERGFLPCIFSMRLSPRQQAVLIPPPPWPF